MISRYLNNSLHLIKSTGALRLHYCLIVFNIETGTVLICSPYIKGMINVQSMLHFDQQRKHSFYVAHICLANDYLIEKESILIQ